MSKETDNEAVVMREALKEIRSRLVYLYGRMDGTFDPPALKEVCGIIDDALAKPPRNCDVGTADEMTARYYKFCSFQSNGTCNDCSLKSSCVKCEMAWGQMPYESDSGKGGEDV